MADSRSYPTLEDVARALEPYGVPVVDWDMNRGEAPVNSPYLVAKHCFGLDPGFWEMTLSQMADHLRGFVADTSHVADDGTLYRAKSIHFSCEWKPGSEAFAFVLGVEADCTLVKPARSRAKDH